MTDDGWEARMSARAKARQAEDREHLDTAAAERAREVFEAAEPRSWLNGWPRMGIDHVLIGTSLHCVCCGQPHGVTCTAFGPDWEPPGPEPTWPFSEDDCPLCSPEAQRLAAISREIWAKYNRSKD